jgi:CheY-like chemotaxis protein
MSAVLQRVAVIDDQPEAAEATSIGLEEAGFTPVVLKDGFREVGALVDAVRSVADAAVCDHRLGFTGYAPFLGAEAVAALIEAKVPAVLVTTYPMDFEVSIRTFRDRLPAVLNRSELADPELVRNALRASADEIAGKTQPSRVLYRTLVSIDRVTEEEGQRVADAVIPGWDPNRAVRFPVSLMRELGKHAEAGKAFFAMVNLGANRSDDLVLTEFSIAPEPDPRDGLA